jgi:hypothetical protein
VSPIETMSVDTVASYARRRADAVDVVLFLPGAPALDEPTTLRLRNGQKTLRCAATSLPTAGGVLVTASVPDRQLGKQVWRLSLLTGEPRTSRQLEARLLASREQPVALLTGPLPETVLQPPRPRATTAPGGPTTPAARARRGAVKVVDTLLSPLPDEQAARYRSALAGVARRVSRPS